MLLSQGHKDKGIFLPIIINISESEVNRIKAMAKQCLVICHLKTGAQIMKSSYILVGFERVGLPENLRHAEVYI